MVRCIRCVAAAVALLTALAIGGTTGPPAGADPSMIQLPKLTLSHQYQVGGCRYKIFWGNYGAFPFALLQLYDPACAGVQIAVRSTSGVWSYSSTATASGSDGCGAFSVVQATGPAGTANAAWAALPDSPGGGLFDGWRFYAADGLQGQSIHSLC